MVAVKCDFVAYKVAQSSRLYNLLCCIEIFDNISDYLPLLPE